MTRLGEEADDARLDAGSQLEERLHSVDWDVWVCPACDETLRVPFKRAFSSYETCPKCQRRTAKVQRRRQVRAPTTFSEGLAEVERACASCQHACTTQERIPRVSRSSGGSGSSGGHGGGSSFGGGSAGGGGAGGRY